MGESAWLGGNVSGDRTGSAGGARVSERDRLLRDLVARAAGGDESALSSLYDETSSLVFGIACRILANPPDAEEVTLDVYTQVWRRSAAFDPQRGSVVAWLAMLTRSRAIDRLRAGAAQARRSTELEDASTVATMCEGPEGAFALAQERQRVSAALAVLPAEQRQSIELAFFSGLSHSEIAASLGLPLGTVKTRIRLAMMKLRESLGAAA